MITSEVAEGPWLKWFAWHKVSFRSKGKIFTVRWEYIARRKVLFDNGHHYWEYAFLDQVKVP